MNFFMSDKLIELFKNAIAKPVVPTTGGTVPSASNPAEAAFGAPTMASPMVNPAMDDMRMFDSGAAADAASNIQSIIGSAGIQNNAASMLKPAQSFLEDSDIGFQFEQVPVAPSPQKPNPVQDEINRAEGEWKDTGMLEDDEEEKAKPKMPTLLMEAAN